MRTVVPVGVDGGVARLVGAGAGVDEGRLEAALGRFAVSKVSRRLESGELAGWMRRCDFGVIGCGTSLYEAAATGLPFVGLALVDNQRATAEKVASDWGMPVLAREGRHEEPLRLEGALARLPKRGPGPFGGVDGRGAERVFAAVEEMLLA